MKNCPTKIIIRRLPPKLTEEDFLKIVAPLPSHSYFRFCPPDDSLGALSLPRAYITFNDIESLFDFKERFDNYVFVDSEGNESYALAEFAVCQTLANIKETSATKKAEKVDKKQGTLHEDPEFIAFVNSLETAEAGSKPADGEPKKTGWEAILEEIQARESAAEKTQEVTPLVAFLHQRELEGRRKEEEYGRHGKPFKQHSVSGTRKASSRAEKVSRGAQVAARRSKEAKRNSVSSYPNREFGHHGKSEDDVVSSGPGGGAGKSQRGEATGNKSTSNRSTPLDADEFPTMQGSQSRPSNPTTGSWSDRPSAWGNTSGTSKDRCRQEPQPGGGGGKSIPASPHTSKPSTPVSSESAVNPNGTESDSKAPVTAKDSKKSSSTHRVSSETHSATVTATTDAGSSDYCSSASLPNRGDSTGYRGRRAGGYYASRSSASFTMSSRRPSKSQRGRRDSDGSLHGYAGDHMDSARDASLERGSSHTRPQSVRGRRGGGGCSGGSLRGSHDNDSDPSYTRGSHRGGHRNNVGSNADDYGEDSYRSSYGDLYGSSSSCYGSGGRGSSAGGGSTSRSRATSGAGTGASSNSGGRRRAAGYSSRGGGSGWSEG